MTKVVIIRKPKKGVSIITKQDVTEMVDVYGDMVFRIAVLHCSGCKTDAEDVFQDVFLALLTTKKQFEEMEHVKAWLIRTTFNLCKKYSAKRKKNPVMETEDIMNYLNSISEQTASEETGELFAALCASPVKYRIVLQLYYLEEYSTKEIADLLHITQAAVRKRLQRGRELLRERGVYHER